MISRTAVSSGGPLATNAANSRKYSGPSTPGVRVARQIASAPLRLAKPCTMPRLMNRVSPGPTACSAPSTVKVIVPSKPYTVSSQFRWKCATGICPDGGTVMRIRSRLPAVSCLLRRNSMRRSPIWFFSDMRPPLWKLFNMVSDGLNRKTWTCRIAETAPQLSTDHGRSA